jgi:hypothetical protein
MGNSHAILVMDFKTVISVGLLMLAMALVGIVEN